jgi:hypothetical protein
VGDEDEQRPDNEAADVHAPLLAADGDEHEHADDERERSEAIRCDPGQLPLTGRDTRE